MHYNQTGILLPVRGWPLKPAAFPPAIGFRTIGLKTISCIVLASTLALAPASAFAQRGAAGAHAGGARAGGVARAPQPPMARPSMPVVNRPATPIITRPPIVTRPTGIVPMTPFRGPVAPVRNPVTSGFLFPPRPPRLPIRPIRPIAPLLGTAGFFGFAYNPFLFPACNPFLGFAFGCGILAPYYGYGGYPAGVYGPAYPAPAYPPDPVYSPPDTSASGTPTASLRYTPELNQYPLAGNLPLENLSGSRSATAQAPSQTLLYLNDGTVFAVSSYTVSDGQLHYLTAYSEKNYFSVELLDLQKTIEANAERGVAFTLTPAPTPATSATKPTPLGPAPAPEGPINPAKQ